MMKSNDEILTEIKRLVVPVDKVTHKVKRTINSLIDEFNTDYREHSLFDTVGSDVLSYSDLDECTDIESYFWQTFKRNTYSLDELCLDDVEEFISELNEFCREFRRTRNKISNLKDLLD